MKILITILLIMTSTIVIAKSPVFVSAQWVNNNLEKIVLIDIGRHAQNKSLHIPNSVYISYSWLIKPQNGISLSGGKEHMQKLLSQLGISDTDHIIIYDNLGGLNASRLYWELVKLNHNKVSILNGGLNTWLLKDYPVTQELLYRQPTIYIANEINLTNEFTASKADVLASIKNENIVLLDTRSKAEFVGNKNKRQRSGHIPTAKFFPWEIVVDTKKGYKQITDKQVIKLLNYFNLNIKDQEIILYCRSGHRATRVFTMLKSQGFTNVKLYDASMQEWILNNENPLKLG